MDGPLQLALAAIVVLLAASLVRITVTQLGYAPALQRLNKAAAAQAATDRAMADMQNGVRAFQLSGDDRLLAPYLRGQSRYAPAEASAAEELASVPAALGQWVAADSSAQQWQHSYAAGAVDAVRAHAPAPTTDSLLRGQSRFDVYSAAAAASEATLARTIDDKRSALNAFRVVTGAVQLASLAVLTLILFRRQRRGVESAAATVVAAAGPAPRLGDVDGLEAAPDTDAAAAMRALASSITNAGMEISGAVAAHLWLAHPDGELRRADSAQPAIVAQRRRHDVALRANREGAITTSVTRSRRLVAVPLLHDGRTWGVVELTMPSGSGEPTSAQTEMLRAWGRQAAKAIARGPGADRDPLTGLAGRPQLLVDVSRAVEAGLTQGRPVSLVLLEIDHINRSTGSGTSLRDDLIRTVGAVLADTVRTSDSSYRTDDGAFAVLLPGATAHAAASLAERLRQIIARRFVERGVTASFGVATCPDTADDGHHLVEAAESGLYDAQRFGGNRAQSARPLADELALIRRRADERD